MDNKKRFDKRDYSQLQQDHSYNHDQSFDKDEVVAKNEKWCPTPECFHGFTVRDEQLATWNLRSVLKNAGTEELTFRDIKDQLLHSADTIERLLAKFIEDGSVKEGKGKYGPTFSMVEARAAR